MQVFPRIPALNELRSLLSRRRHGIRLSRNHRRSAVVEPLEQRVMPAQFIVTSTNNDGPGSLRQAIVDANDQSGDDIISFRLDGDGVHRIRPTSPLPTVTDTVRILGWSQTGAAAQGGPVIEIDGSLTTDASGLWITADDSVVEGLNVHSFDRYGIAVRGADDVHIRGSYIGVSANGLSDRGNGRAGVLVFEGATNTLLGTDGDSVLDDREGNLISGNGTYGVWILGASETKVAGNIIGLNKTGTAPIPNDEHGILVDDDDGVASINNSIGGPMTVQRNVISGNGKTGVYLWRSAGNDVSGNYIGTTADGVSDAGNGEHGVRIQTDSLATPADGNRVGGDFTGRRNVISGNGLSGIELWGTRNTIVQANYLGVGADGTTELENGKYGLLVASTDSITTSNTAVGGRQPQAGNVISGNAESGVFVWGAADTAIVRNQIGLAADGSTVIPNSYGIQVRQTNDGVGSVRTTIGGDDLSDRNLIAGNEADGILVLGDKVRDTTIQGNWIGLKADGVTPAGNADDGISVLEAREVTVKDNTIVANASDGIDIGGSPGATEVSIYGNFIGSSLDSRDDPALGNGDDGIQVASGATNVTIGSAQPADRNIITYNKDIGISISGAGTTSITVAGNYIGVDQNGKKKSGNNIGVYIGQGASGNTIGGSANGAGNLISGNTSDGIWIEDAGTQQNLVEGNLIGVNEDGDVALPNRYGVVLHHGTTDNILRGNTISGNDLDGIWVGEFATRDNIIESNIVGLAADGQTPLGNGGRGITFSGAGPNQVGGVQSGAGNVISDNGSDGILIYRGAQEQVIEGNLIGVAADGTTARGNDGRGIWIFGGRLQGNPPTIVYVLDVSGSTDSAFPGTSVGDLNGDGKADTRLDAELAGLIQLTEELETLGFGDVVEIGIVSFTNSATQLDMDTQAAGKQLSTKINADTNGNGVSDVIDRLRTLQSGGLTNFSNALQGAIDTFEDLGTRSGDGNLIFTSDGVDSSNMDSQLARLSQLGVRSIAVGVGPESNVSQLKRIDEDAEQVRTTDEFSEYILSVLGLNSTAGSQGQAGTQTTIGGLTAGAGNVIANNGSNGIDIRNLLAIDNSVLGNSIYNNGGLGIDIGGNGVTANDAGDADAGANQFMNYPELESAINRNGTVQLTGSFSGAAAQTMTVQLFGNSTTDPSGHGEGEVLLQTFTATTDASGQFDFVRSFELPNGLAHITATATDSNGNTSEFSQSVSVSSFQPSLVLNKTAITVSESGTTDTFAVSLSHAPTSDVVVLITSDGTVEATVDPSILTFTPSNWNVPQTVTATGEDDDLLDGDKSWDITVRVEPSQSDDAFDNMPSQVVQLTVTDDESGANLHLTSAILVDHHNVPQGNPVYGQNTYVRANWNSERLTGSESSITVRYTANFPAGYFYAGSPATSFPADSASVSMGSGGGSWVWYRGGWYSGTASYTFTVTVDPDNLIAESNETDNTLTITVNPVAPTDLPAKFIQPIGLTPNKDWSINNYADIDPRPDSALDYRLGRYQYDGHDAIDAGPWGFGEQDDGIPLVAAAAGVVTRIDGGSNFDRENSFNSNPWNAVYIDHGNGWVTQYGHLAANSTTVEVGDSVTAGDILGLMGSAGNSTGSHIHYTLFYRGSSVEEGFAPNTYWVDPLPYGGDVPVFAYASGVSNYDPVPDGSERIEEINTVPVDSDGSDQLYFWVQTYGLNEGDELSWRYYRPNGTLAFSNTFELEADYRDSWWYWRRPISSFQGSTGTWQVGFEVDSVEISRTSFTVAAQGAASIRVADSDDKVLIDGRTTPLNFGSVALGGSSSQQTLTIRNQGYQPLTLSDFQLPAGFGFVGNPPTSIASGATASLTVQLLTSVPGVKFGALQFSTNAPDIPYFELVLTGAITGDAMSGSPSISAGDESATDYSLDALPSLLFPGAAVVDADSSSFSGGSLTAELVTFGSNDDRLAIRNEGTATGEIGISGNEILYGGLLMGTFAGGAGATPLVVSLLSNATIAATQALVRNFTYRYVGIEPTTQRKAVSISLVDNTGLKSKAVTEHIINTGVATGDTAGFTVSKSTLVVSEDGTSIVDSFSIVLTAEPAFDVTLELSLSDDPDAEIDLSLLTFTAANWDVAQTVNVTGLANQIANGDQTTIITVAVGNASSDDAYDDLPDQTVTVITTDDDSPFVTLALADASISENGGTTTATVTRNTGTTAPLVVNLSSSNTEAANVPVSVTIPAGQAAATFAVSGVDNSIADGTLMANIQATATNHTSASANINVTDDETANITLALALDSISENGGTTTGTITRNTDTTSALVVNLSSSNTEAATVPATVTIPAGQSSATFTVSGVDNSIADGTLTVNIEASATEHTSASASINVTDDETANITLALADDSISENGGTTTGTITRNTDTTSALVVSLSSSNMEAATVPATVTIPAGQSSATFTVSGVDNSIADGTLTVNIEATATDHTSASANINVTDNETANITLALAHDSISENGGTTTATITRNTGTTAPLVVNLSSSNTEAANVPVSVTIPAGQAAATFAVSGVDNSIADGTLMANIQATANDHTSASANINVTDDETANITLALALDSISENGGTTTATITRNTDTAAPLVVNLSSSNTETATVPATVTIPAGQSSATFTVSGVDNSIADGTLTVNIEATATDHTSASANINVTDDETANITLALADDSISENGGTTTGTITRNTDTTSALVVSLSSSNTEVATVPATVTIPAGQSSATFTVSGVDNSIADGTLTVNIEASATEHTSASASINVTDDETANITLALADDSITENGGTSTGTITRNTDTTSALVVSLSSSNTEAATVPATVTIPAGQSSATFTVTGVDNSIADGTLTVNIEASATEHTSASASINVTDDETANITLALSDDSISENGGTTTGTITRNTDTTSALVVSLSSSNTEVATVPATVTIPAGQSSATFTVTGVDNSIADGTLTVNIEASATEHTSASASINVTDDETANITLALSDDSISENGGTTTGTITRNTDTTSALVVSLSSSNTEAATVPAAVTIPAGQSSATFTVTGVDNSIVDGTVSATIEATASGHTSGTAVVDVTDDDSIDGKVQHVGSSHSSITATPGSIVELPVIYKTLDSGNPVTLQTSLISFNLHFDSSVLSFIEATDVFSEGVVVLPNAVRDESDISVVGDDNDLATDSVLVAAFDDSDSAFAPGWPNNPSTDGLTLYTARFRVSDDFVGTSINFSANSTGVVFGGAANFQFSSESVTIAASTRVADVDGDNDFDANDAFLVHLVQLAGTNLQIDQSKGSSELSATEIRTAIQNLAAVADVDGDSDFDANDSFLIQLVKLAGADIQIDQSKGASPLTATEIRARVEALGANGASGEKADEFNSIAAALNTDRLAGKNQQLFPISTEYSDSERVVRLEPKPAEIDLVLIDYRNWIDAIRTT